MPSSVFLHSVPVALILHVRQHVELLLADVRPGGEQKIQMITLGRIAGPVIVSGSQAFTTGIPRNQLPLEDTEPEP